MPRKKVWNQVLEEGNQNWASKIVEDSGYTYIAIAQLGTAESEAKWQVRRVDETTAGTTIITWADGDDEFNQVATDLTALTYS